MFEDPQGGNSGLPPTSSKVGRIGLRRGSRRFSPLIKLMIKFAPSAPLGFAEAYKQLAAT